MDADGGAESNDGLRVAEMGSALLFRRWRDFGGCTLRTTGLAVGKFLIFHIDFDSIC